MIRKPDAAYIAPGRLSDDQYDDDGYCTVVPDLVVEVLSPNDLASRVNAKVDDWLDAGVKLVWVVDPDAEIVQVHTASGSTQRLRSKDTLSDAGVLPGFSLSLADVFRRTVAKPQS